MPNPFTKLDEFSNKIMMLLKHCARTAPINHQLPIYGCIVPNSTSSYTCRLGASNLKYLLSPLVAKFHADDLGEIPMLNAQTVAPDQTQAAIQRIVDASRRVPRGDQALVMAIHIALDDLQDAVDEARLLDVAWGKIEDALGIWRVQQPPTSPIP